MDCRGLWCLRTPTSCSMRSHTATSASKPSQPEDVPFQTMTSTRASASRRAASRSDFLKLGQYAGLERNFSHRKPPKYVETSGKSVNMAEARGSGAVLNEGVNIPISTCIVPSNFGASRTSCCAA
jgi:hypothetical protein